MNELKVIVVGNKILDISTVIAEDKLKDAELWQITTNEKLVLPNNYKKIVFNNNFQTNILQAFLWKAERTIIVV